MMDDEDEGIEEKLHFVGDSDDEDDEEGDLQIEDGMIFSFILIYFIYIFYIYVIIYFIFCCLHLFNR